MAELINSSVFNGITVAVVGSGGGGSGVSQLTSTDGSVTLTPSTGVGEVDLSVVYPPITDSVLSLNALINNVTIVSGTNTTVTTNSEENTIAINSALPVTDRTSTVLVPLITATTIETAQTVATLTLSTSYISNIDVFLSFTVQTNSNIKHDIDYTISIGGVASSTFKNTLNGINHYGSCSSGASRENVPAGDIEIIVKMYASVSGVFTVTPLQMIAIGNLS